MYQVLFAYPESPYLVVEGSSWVAPPGNVNVNVTCVSPSVGRDLVPEGFTRLEERGSTPHGAPWRLVVNARASSISHLGFTPPCDCRGDALRASTA